MTTLPPPGVELLISELLLPLSLCMLDSSWMPVTAEPLLASVNKLSVRYFSRALTYCFRFCTFDMISWNMTPLSIKWRGF